jgi:hypothetical protein
MLFLIAWYIIGNVGDNVTAFKYSYHDFFCNYHFKGAMDFFLASPCSTF